MNLPPVAKTAVLTLRARADEHDKPTRLFADPLAARWREALPWPRELDRWYSKFSQVKTAARAYAIDRLVAGLVSDGRPTLVVELGAGFSTRAARLPSPHVEWLVVDLPEVIAARAALGEIARTHAGSALELDWAAAIGRRRAILVAEGLLYYLPEPEVRAWFLRLPAAAPGAAMIFDLIGARDLGRSRARSREVGAEIGWAIDPPLETAAARLGLRPIPGLAPDFVLTQELAGYARSYGPAFGAALRLSARWFGDTRSGIVTGLVPGRSGSSAS